MIGLKCGDGELAALARKYMRPTILSFRCSLVNNYKKHLSTSTTTPDSRRRFCIDSKRPKYLISGVWRSAELIRRL